MINCLRVLFFCFFTTWAVATDHFIFYQQGLYTFCDELKSEMQEKKNLEIEIRTDEVQRVFEAIQQSTADGIFIKRKLTEDEKKSYPDLEEIPIMTDALLFFVDARLEISNLTKDQIFDCFFKQISWSKVTGKDYPYLKNPLVKPYLNSSGAGDSQVFLEKMNAIILDESPQRLLIQGQSRDGVLFKQFVDIQNSDKKKIRYLYQDTGRSIFSNVIGYVSLNPGRVLLEKTSEVSYTLSIDGIEASPENIKKGIYPFAYDCHLVVKKNDKSQKIIEFIELIKTEVFTQFVKNFYYIPKE